MVWPGLCFLLNQFHETIPSISLPSVGVAGPPFFVTLSGSGGTQVAGEDYTLTCLGQGSLDWTPMYRWYKGKSQLVKTSYILSFSPLRDIDSGDYTCEVTIDSFTVTSPIVVITVVSKSEEYSYFSLGPLSI